MGIKIINKYTKKENYTLMEREHHTREGVSISEFDVSSEHMLEVYINDVPSMRLVCLNSELEELVLGWLKTEGFIKDIEEIESLYICEQGISAKVYLKDSEREVLKAAENLETIKPIPWEEEWIYYISREFNNFSPLFKKTHGTHCAYLVREGKILYKSDDLGRHTAVDKVVGRALLDGVDLKSCLLYCSGRIPLDMVKKIIRAGIPVVITKAVPTDIAIEYAKKYKLTMICRARDESFDVYTKF